MAFPVLSIGMDLDFSSEPAYFNTTVSKMENGIRSTRPKHTSVPDTFVVKYTGLTDADRVLLDTFYETTVSMGSDAFDWHNMQDNDSYSVKFLGTIDYKVNTGLIPERRWDATFELIVN